MHPPQRSQEEHNYITEAEAEALKEARAVASDPSTIASIRKGLWNSKFRLGVRIEDDKMIQEKNTQLQISAQLFAKAITPHQKAQYLSDLIDGVSYGKVPHDAPSACGSNTMGLVDKLDPPQLVPKILITPSSPLQRLIVVQPPGAGKTCIMLDIMSNFLTEDYNILIVGDPDIFSSVLDGLRACPAMAPEGPLRDRNANNKNRWCALYSNAKRHYFDEGRAPKDCDGGLKFNKARIYWLSYVRFGNWLKGQHAKYKNDEIFKANTLILLDEVHKLTAPSEERASPRWRESLLYVGEQLFRAPQDQAPDKKVFVVGFTATPIIDDPVQAICLATVMKGHTDPSIFTDKNMTKLRIDPKKFYTPEFVNIVDTISVREPGPSLTEHSMSTSHVAEILKKNNCIGATINKEKGISKDIHPCPVSAADRAKNIYSVYSLKQSTADNLERLFSNLFFVTNNTADTRKYPSLVETSRLVSYTSKFSEAATAAMKKHAGKVSWQEVSNFANGTLLQHYVRRRLIGMPHTIEDDTMFEHNAPKWRSFVHDLYRNRELSGKIAVYLGAGTVPGVATSTEYLFGLSFYLQAKLGLVDGTIFPETRHAAVYIIADEADYKELEAARKAADGPEKRVTLTRSTEFRRTQRLAFNKAPCFGEVSTGARYSIVLLGYESYKALNLECATNLVRMVLQPAGKTEQTIGRARRQCAFARIPKQKWKVNAVTYIFHASACPEEDCDCLLGSFFAAQSQLQEQILKILRGASIACSNYKDFNQWPNGTVCLLDKGASLKRTPDEQTRNFYFCSYSGLWKYDPEENVTHLQYADLTPQERQHDVKDYHRAPIRPGVSGDVTPQLVKASCAGRCSDLDTSLQIPPPILLAHHRVPMMKAHARSQSIPRRAQRQYDHKKSPSISTRIAKRRDDHTKSPHVSSTRRTKRQDDHKKSPPASPKKAQEQYDHKKLPPASPRRAPEQDDDHKRLLPLIIPTLHPKHKELLKRIQHKPS